MVLELHIWGPAFSLPSVDPQCVATIAYFVLALPPAEWVLIADSDPGLAPTCMFPFSVSFFIIVSEVHRVV
jgi:sorting and assembly machinery component 37